jgi:hypothetical protein
LPQILDVQRASASTTLIVKGSIRGANVFGIAAETGQMVWRCAGPIGFSPRDGSRLPNSVLHLSDTSQPPVVYFRYGFQNECRLGQAVADLSVDRGRVEQDGVGESSIVPLDSAPGQIALRVPARLGSQLSTDSRWLRPLPWHISSRDLDQQTWQFFGRAVYWAVALIIAPIAYIGWCWRKMTMLKLLILPLIVAVMLQPLLSAGIQHGVSGVFEDFITAIMAAIPLLSIFWLSRWMWLQRWKPVVGWVAVVLVNYSVFALFALRMDQRRAALHPLERYDWSEWYHLLPVAIFFACALLMLSIAGKKLLSGLWHTMDRKMAVQTKKELP